MELAPLRNSSDQVASAQTNIFSDFPFPPAIPLKYKKRQNLLVNCKKRVGLPKHLSVSLRKFQEQVGWGN